VTKNQQGLGKSMPDPRHFTRGKIRTPKKLPGGVLQPTASRCFPTTVEDEDIPVHLS